MSNDCSTAITVIFTATDACGNTATTSATFTVQDSTDPVAPMAPEAVTVSCIDEVPATISLTATDNCAGEITVNGVDTTTPGNCPNSLVITRTWTFTDACSNSVEISQTITVNDTIAPTFVEELPADVTVECDAVPTAATLTATDNCGEATVSFTEATQEGQCANTYVVTRTWTATDLCGNETAHTQTITVQDTTAPAFVEELPADVTVECNDIPAPATLTATDSCGTATVEFSVETQNVICEGSYTLVRTWVAMDECGNSTSHTQTVTVQDTIAPVFVEELPSDITVECNEIPAAVTLSATDSCGTATVELTETIEPGECAGESIITRSWVASDSCGNNVSHVQIIVVQDTTGPVSSEFEENLTVNCDAIPEVPTLTFSDACSTVNEPIFTQNIINETSTSYTIERIWEVSDNCGNLSTFIQTIEVSIQNSLTRIDTEACIGDITTVDLDTLLPDGTTGGVWVDINNTGALNGNIFNPSAVSAIGNYILQYEITEGDCPRIYEVTMNVNDDCLVFPCDAIVIHNAFTPNGDALNQYFSIENIENTECYTSNTVEIYNRWGVLVYEVENYNNNDRRFEGISEGRATLNKNAELPTGTYFYIINYTTVDGNVVNKSGYLYLTR
ncbi:gliding motility-associated C-terminal domain-containing protein [Flavobacterium sp.]|uniref:gliding motility-associated C-terminal domain-containing protein n=1 Tax=Flavobacterium sp. TaxID=239 RepID=UPI003526F02D